MKTIDKLLKARTQLLLSNPFFGVLCLSLGLHDATDSPDIPTMATDGTHLFYDSNFVDSLTLNELIFVLAHEIYHCTLNHHLRRKSRDPKRWNIAADHAINLDLKSVDIGTMPEGGLADPQYAGMSAEQIYELLPECESGGGNGANDPGRCGQILDAPESASPSEAAKAEAEMKIKVRQAANVARAQKEGKLPAELQRMIDQMLAPSVDWRAILRSFIDDASTKDYAWTPPSRRLLPLGYITPGLITDGVSHITVAVDTSGSIDDNTLNQFAAEIRGAMDEGSVDSVSVIYCDARVQDVDNFDMGDVLDMRPKGGGGTDFAPVMHYVRERRPDTRLLIYLTDGYCNSFGAQPDCPVVWATYGNDGFTPPFGDTVPLSVQ